MSDLSPRAKEFEDALHAIGWELRHCGQNVYRIMNHRHETTAFTVDGKGEALVRLWDSRGVMGKDNWLGAVYCNLDKTEIQLDTQTGAVNIGSGACWISFYNFDK